MLRWLCQYSGTFARADQETGYLCIEPFWSQGNRYELGNLDQAPGMSANDNLGELIFKYGDTGTSLPGSLAESANTLTIDNPFVTDITKAQVAARTILTAYGGNKLSISGRGDPSSEIGDVATVDLDAGHSATARIISQTFTFAGGVLRGCRSELLQANGAQQYENSVRITTSGTWTAPEGVEELYIILVGGGQAGGHGLKGTRPYISLFSIPTSPGYTYGEQGEAGVDGAGGKVWYGTIQINPQQTFEIVIGAGGTPGTAQEPTDGNPTTMGIHTSEDGRSYDPSFTDISAGNAYGRTGIDSPVEGYGDGGKGGAGGDPGWYRWDSGYESGVTVPGETDILDTNMSIVEVGAPKDGQAGKAGSKGCVVIYWATPET